MAKEGWSIAVLGCARNYTALESFIAIPPQVLLMLRPVNFLALMEGDIASLQANEIRRLRLTCSALAGIAA